jgi:ornithine cyclodeaminase/alanine dehydrogenase
VDDKEQARLEAGDFVTALNTGLLTWDQVHELGDVLIGKQQGRVQPREVTLFKSIGIGLEDVAVAARVYAAAKEQGIGREIG